MPKEKLQDTQITVAFVWGPIPLSDLWLCFVLCLCFQSSSLPHQSGNAPMPITVLISTLGWDFLKGNRPCPTLTDWRDLTSLTLRIPGSLILLQSCSQYKKGDSHCSHTRDWVAKRLPGFPSGPTYLICISYPIHPPSPPQSCLLGSSLCSLPQVTLPSISNFWA